MAKIKEITAREILDSRGNPTIEATVTLSDNTSASASCPSGASVGTYEAMELRDNNPDRMNGMGVLKAIENIENSIAPQLRGMEAENQVEVDKAMIDLDGTPNKSILGANATLSVSMATARVAAKSSAVPLFLYLRQFTPKKNSLKIPTPLFNIINGGKHAHGNIDFQEFQIIPASHIPYAKALELADDVYKSLEKLLLEKNLSTLIGDEGGFAPTLTHNSEAFGLLKQAIEATNLRLSADMFLGLDAASNSFFKDNKYHLKDRNVPYSSDDMIEYYKNLLTEYNLLYLEDPLSEDDWEGWQKLLLAIGSQTLIVGDDLTVTNPYRLQMAMTNQSINGIIIKPNQIGTVIETLAVVEAARSSNLQVIVSHRSGETNDDFIADFAVAVSADYVKFGAPARGERVAKYNRLLQIDEQLRTIEGNGVA